VHKTCISVSKIIMRVMCCMAWQLRIYFHTVRYSGFICNKLASCVPNHYESPVLHDIIYCYRIFSRGLPRLLFYIIISFCLFLLVQYQVVGVLEGEKFLSCILSDPAGKRKWNFLSERWWLTLLSLHSLQRSCCHGYTLGAPEPKWRGLGGGGRRTTGAAIQY
jgi:hypothetical protein